MERVTRDEEIAAGLDHILSQDAELLRRLGDEAERGYPVEQLRERGRRRAESQADAFVATRLEAVPPAD